VAAVTWFNHNCIDPIIKEIKFKLGLSNQNDQREEIEPLNEIGSSIRVVEEIDSDWDNADKINLSMT